MRIHQRTAYLVLAWGGSGAIKILWDFADLCTPPAPVRSTMVTITRISKKHFFRLPMIASLAKCLKTRKFSRTQLSRFPILDMSQLYRILRTCNVPVAIVWTTANIRSVGNHYIVINDRQG